ncbi:DUF6456 domain-containing protein [Blastochloris viridis]|uniref:Chromosomal replication initiator protein DnaA n=1 Tax=Blastochloris viridis TaxID=1079 RepID=A0A0H5BCJ2_BLAVI|nr:DUF6456 domain-containing protein [Blastochloris viridis]ALK10138.1 hypothetical protein BVIR_2371 [Blastochloris viridis]BAR99932.1 chromosomal replication initiator protein DnaA [Blastochloris viridis]CUU42802.1 hypothetical protein BVIRIDIS_18170 [Blastochloris viridis]
MTARKRAKHPTPLAGDALLLALADGATAAATHDGTVALARPDGRHIATTAAALADLCARGLIAIGRAGRFEPSNDGNARLARLTATAQPFLAQHRTLEPATVAIDGLDAEVLCDADESPLAWLARRKDKTGRPLLAPHQFAAGERLRADFTRAQMTPRLTADWGGAATRGGGSRDPAAFADAAVAAKERLTTALDTAGPELSGVLLDVCCFLKGLEAVERERNWPARTAKVVLGLALDRLARHYGLGSEARGPARGRLRAWSAGAGE